MLIHVVTCTPTWGASELTSSSSSAPACSPAPHWHRPQLPLHDEPQPQSPRTAQLRAAAGLHGSGRRCASTPQVCSPALGAPPHPSQQPGSMLLVASMCSVQGIHHNALAAPPCRAPHGHTRPFEASLRTLTVHAPQGQSKVLQKLYIVNLRLIACSKCLWAFRAPQAHTAAITYVHISSRVIVSCIYSLYYASDRSFLKHHVKLAVFGFRCPLTSPNSKTVN